MLRIIFFLLVFQSASAQTIPSLPKKPVGIGKQPISPAPDPSKSRPTTNQKSSAQLLKERTEQITSWRAIIERNASQLDRYANNLRDYSSSSAASSLMLNQYVDEAKILFDRYSHSTNNEVRANLRSEINKLADKAKSEYDRLNNSVNNGISDLSNSRVIFAESDELFQKMKEYVNKYQLNENREIAVYIRESKSEMQESDISVNVIDWKMSQLNHDRDRSWDMLLSILNLKTNIN